MRHRIVSRLIGIGIGAILALPVAGYAQEATLSGTVRDTTGGVLPGVTVTATHEATGNIFTAVTDERGAYRLVVRPGQLRITAELTGFTTVVRTGIELLVGRQVVVSLEMAVSAVQETVTVTGEAPLVDTTSSVVSSSIDPRQMSELPLQGRNWMELSLLAPSSRTRNAASEVPQDRQGYFQVNVDGQQVTQLICCAQQQVRYSRDAISEFELITNRFDATMGRSQGMVVNAVTKSGTNALAGTFSGYFRDDKLSTKDFVQNRVLPYSNQQLVGTFGGPIRRDRIHFFANYEYEREPATVAFTSPYPSFNVDLEGKRRQHSGVGKADLQFTPESRLSVRYAKYYQLLPNQSTGGATNHPSTAQDIERATDQIWATFTQVLSNRTLNQIKGGYSVFNWKLLPVVTWGGNTQRVPGGGHAGFPGAQEFGGGSVRINFSGYAIGTASNSPQDISQYLWSIRDDFTTSFERGGRHDIRAGGEFHPWRGTWQGWCNRCNGVLTIPARAPANIEQLFPVWNDASTWNLDALSLLVRNYQQSVGDNGMENTRQVAAFWFQDDWAPTDRLTLNLGVRYDLDINGRGENQELLPWLSGNRPQDLNNVAPRLGFAFQVNDRTVVRGGYGLFYTQLESDATHQTTLWRKTLIPQLLNDGRADFASNPWNGPAPSYDEAFANACDQTNSRPGCFQRSITIEIPGPSEKGMKTLHEISYSHQASLGVQRQLGATMAVEVNYVWTGGRKDETNHNMNLTWNPATGANYDFRDRSHLPFPDWGVVLGEFMTGRTDYHALETTFRKRFSNRWQAQASYSLSGFWDSSGDPVQVLPDGKGGITWQPLGFALAPDIGDDYTLAATDQRHKAVINGIWELGYGFQVSGLYFFGSGERYYTSWGGDLRNTGSASGQSGSRGSGSNRLRPDGTIVPRNTLVGDAIHRVDLRLTKRVQLGARATLEGLVEVFNTFNHANYGSYTTSVSSARFGQPSFNGNVAYRPRTAQLGFRLAF